MRINKKLTAGIALLTAVAYAAYRRRKSSDPPEQVELENAAAD